MDSLWYSIVQWLHTLGLHVDGQAARAVGEAAARATATLDTPGLLALAAALGWASGLRLYAVVFITGLAGLAGWVALPDGLQVLQHPALLVASGFMLFVEFFADKIPGLDSVWDLLHTVIRIPAGAALAAGCQPVLVLTGNGALTAQRPDLDPGIPRIGSLAELPKWLEQQGSCPQ